jgi:creatinine amidohydrolase
MQWENLTAPDFARAVQETDVCVVAMGVLERHGEHLPLGTDFLNAHKIACLAAEKEPAVVFPPFYFGQIYEARCFPGALTLRPTLLLDLLRGVLDEIGRNGLKKIVLFNGHGGNTHLLSFLAQSTLWEENPYSVYVPSHRLTPERQAIWDATVETTLHGHACECETSISLANHAHLVHMERVPDDPQAGAPLRRLQEMPPTFSGVSWYADYP